MATKTEYLMAHIEDRLQDIANDMYELQQENGRLRAELDEARKALATTVQRLSTAYDDTDIRRGMNAVGEVHDDLTMYLPMPE